MNKRSYIRRNRFKERNIKNEVIRIDNARINKLIENKKNSAKSIKLSLIHIFIRCTQIFKSVPASRCIVSKKHS